MRKVHLLLAAFFSTAACGVVEAAPRTSVLETFHYRVTITVECAEREVTCNRVHYRSVEKRTGAGLSLTGHTEHELCADGRTPCRFVGYAFARGPYRYLVSDSGELIVHKGKKEVLRELGHWQH